MLRNILASILFRKKTISTILLMIVLLGVLSYVTFPKEEMPEIDLKTVALIVEYKGMSSSEIEKLITEPLERKLMSLQDIDEIVSISKDNIASFMIAFELNTKIQNLSKLIRNTITDASEELPAEMEIIEVKEYDSSMFSNISSFLESIFFFITKVLTGFNTFSSFSISKSSILIAFSIISSFSSTSLSSSESFIFK